MRRGKQKRRGGGPRPLPKTPPPPPTTYDNINMPLRCIHCDEIFNGPHKGEKVAKGSQEYRTIDRETAGISDGYCGRKSCIDSEINDTVAQMKARHPEHEERISAFETDLREHSYRSRREDKDRFPEGLIEDE